MRILIFLHTAQSVAGRLQATLVEQGHQVYLARPVLGEPLPISLTQADGLVVLGGPMSSQDSELAGERRLIERFLGLDRPFFGVCLGAQMLNLAYGGQVAPACDQRVQMGWHPVTAQIPSLQGLRRVYQWHSDWIDPAADFEISAVDDQGGVQGIVSGRHHGVQFHPEADASVRELWLARASHKLTGPGAFGPEQHRLVGRQEDARVARWLRGYLSAWSAQSG